MVAGEEKSWGHKSHYDQFSGHHECTKFNVNLSSRESSWDISFWIKGVTKQPAIFKAFSVANKEIISDSLALFPEFLDALQTAVTTLTQITPLESGYRRMWIFFAVWF